MQVTVLLIVIADKVTVMSMPWIKPIHVFTDLFNKKTTFYIGVALKLSPHRILGEQEERS